MNIQVNQEANRAPNTLTEVMNALKKEKLDPRHQAKNWGDWIVFPTSSTVISIESQRRLTTRATVETEGDEPCEITSEILSAFRQLGWVGEDEDGTYEL